MSTVSDSNGVTAFRREMVPLIGTGRGLCLCRSSEGDQNIETVSVPDSDFVLERVLKRRKEILSHRSDEFQRRGEPKPERPQRRRPQDVVAMDYGFEVRIAHRATTSVGLPGQVDLWPLRPLSPEDLTQRLPREKEPSLGQLIVDCLNVYTAPFFLAVQKLALPCSRLCGERSERAEDIFTASEAHPVWNIVPDVPVAEIVMLS